MLQIAIDMMIRVGMQDPPLITLYLDNLIMMIRSIISHKILSVVLMDCSAINRILDKHRYIELIKEQ